MAQQTLQRKHRKVRQIQAELLADSVRPAERGDIDAIIPEERTNCTARLEAEETNYIRWRRHAGALACDLSGSGPSGGFCLNSGQRKRGGNHMMAHALADLLAELLVNATVLDVGAGLGQYGQYFESHAPSVRWTGIDGAENIELVTGGRVGFADIADGLPPALRRRFDWVMSIEAAEHVPRVNEAALMHALVAHARHGIILSWAGLGHEAGLNHANCQSREYVTCAMAALGMFPDASLTRRLADAAVQGKASLPWLRGSLGAYRPTHESVATPGKAASAEVASLRRHMGFPLPTAQFGARYEAFTRRHCGYERHGCNATRFPCRQPWITACTHHSTSRSTSRRPPWQLDRSTARGTVKRLVLPPRAASPPSPPQRDGLLGWLWQTTVHIRLPAWLSRAGLVRLQQFPISMRWAVR